MDFDFQWLRTSASTPADRAMRVPLSIYVLWHPEFADGPLLARTIAEWCNGGITDMRAAGQGIPVHFRSARWRAANALRPSDAPPEPAEPDEPVAARMHRRYAWRRPIDLEEAEHNVFVPLVDDHLVDDPSWRRDLLDLARRHHAGQRARASSTAAGAPHVHLIPIQITPAWAHALKSRAVYDPKSRSAVLVFENFAAPQGKDYQLWALRPDGVEQPGRRLHVTWRRRRVCTLTRPPR